MSDRRSNSLPALTLWQPYASLVACGAKTIETRGQRTRYRGRIAIHASSVPQPMEPATVALPAIHDALWPHLGFTTRPMPSDVREFLPRGAIVATAEIVDCVPIVALNDAHPGSIWQSQAPPASEAGLWFARPGSMERAENRIDQLPYGDFTPGRWGWMLDDIKPTTERCPWCWGKGYGPDGVDVGGVVVVAFDTPYVQCPTCEGRGHCAPVPARGMPGMWRWRP